MMLHHQSMIQAIYHGREKHIRQKMVGANYGCWVDSSYYLEVTTEQIKLHRAHSVVVAVAAGRENHLRSSLFHTLFPFRTFSICADLVFTTVFMTVFPTFDVRCEQEKKTNGNNLWFDLREMLSQASLQLKFTDLLFSAKPSIQHLTSKLFALTQQCKRKVLFFYFYFQRKTNFSHLPLTEIFICVRAITFQEL